MKIDDGIKALTAFFNDIISAVIPGVILLIGVDLIHEGILSNSKFRALTGEASTPWLCIALAFSIGHALLEFHAYWILKVFPRQKANSELETKQSFKLFRSLVNTKIQSAECHLNDEKLEWDHRDLRNVAFSVSPEAASLGRRFMAISLLCSGLASASFLLAADYIATNLWWHGHTAFCGPKTYTIAGLLLLSGFLCSRRAKEFFRRAETTPFGVAFADLLMVSIKSKDSKSTGAE